LCANGGDEKDGGDTHQVQNAEASRGGHGNNSDQGASVLSLGLLNSVRKKERNA
jgi:hypothetical protein